MKQRVLIIFALLGAMFSSLSCNKVKEISVTSFEIVSVTPRGLNELEALVKIGIHNPTMSFEVTDLVGTAKIEGKPCLSLSADQLIVAGKCDKIYSLPVKGKISEGFNPFQLLKLINGASIDLASLTADVNAKISLRGGVGKKLELKDLRLDKFMQKDETSPTNTIN